MLALALALGACGTSSGDDSPRARARGALARDGWSGLTLHPVEGEPDTFDFEGEREGRRCEGTIRVSGSRERPTSAIRSRCP